MAFDRVGQQALEYEPCRYDGSRLLFRGPKRRLDGDFVAFLGGTDTYGKFIARPFPALIEMWTGVKCINFGWPNAGTDVYLNDPGLLGIAARARLTVLQVPCAQNMSNRFYQVHPRRNDRFVQASDRLRALYEEVDFTEFHFVRHMLRHLSEVSPERFEKVRQELAAAWVPRMRSLVERVGGPVALLWFSSRSPDQDGESPDLASDPSFVTRPMLEGLRGKVHQIVEVVASVEAQRTGVENMIFAQSETPAAAALLNPAAHDEAARALLPIVTDQTRI